MYYISLGARFSNYGGDYHTVPLYFQNGVCGDIKHVTRKDAIDGVREAYVRLQHLGLVDEVQFET